MKKLKLLSAAIALVFYGVAIANVTAADHPPQNLSGQIHQLLQGSTFDVEKGAITARVLFKVDGDNRIELVEVDSKRSDLKWFLKRNLNGRKVILTATEKKSDAFVIDIKITPEI
ncbi:MAG: hypothetical protein CMH48_10495 [Muricauda sp.]|nr:hypothetical protein [Allomuricauda sp.]MAU25943.1 hypothetical protein [Allomuricauda sp.]MBC31263.1 hypothetical protein [Allomuricauda sp.]|tara:strand:- start:439 stop:783 length:345 start_codon:yes stop_codon:yes gene_type:complete